MELRAEGLTKGYDGKIVIDQVSFSVSTGETLVLLGTSGSGKTTCLKMINRLIEPEAGAIYLNGEDVRAQSPTHLRRQIGYVIQQVGLFPHLTVAQNIGTVPRLLGWSAARREDRCTELLAMLGLEPEMAQRMPSQLSGGQQQRVGIARALAADPAVVLLDEPFGALDPITRADIQREFVRLPAIHQKTMVLVTHDVLEAVRLGDKIALLDQGRLQQLGSPQDLIFSPTNDFVRRFFDPQRFSLQLEVVTLADLPAEHVLEPDQVGLVLAEKSTVGQALQALEEFAGQKKLSRENQDGSRSYLGTREELLKAYYRTVEAWAS